MKNVCQSGLCWLVAFLAVLGGGTLRAEVEPKAQILDWSTCLHLAIANNPDFQLAQMRVQQVEGRLLVARANFLPNIAGTAVSLPPTLVFGFSQPVYSRALAPTFRTFPTARAAAQANVQLALLELVYRLRSAYAQAYFAQELAKVTERETQLVEDRLQRAPEIFAAGRMTKADQVALEVRVSLTQDKLSQARLSAETQRLNLDQTTGLPPDDPRLTGGLNTSFQVETLPVEEAGTLAQRALAQRLDLKILRDLKKIADETIIITSAAAYPQAGVGASLFSQFETPSFLHPLTKELDPQSAQQDIDNNDIQGKRADLTFLANWRLLDWGDVSGQVRGARADEVKQEILIAQLEREIPRQVATALDSAQRSDRLYRNLLESNTAAESLKVAQSNYEAGLISQLEILDAQQELILNEANKLRLGYARDLALAALDRATGQAVKVEEVQP